MPSSKNAILLQEEWREVANTNGMLLVSNMGRVKRLGLTGNAGKKDRIGVAYSPPPPDGHVSVNGKGRRVSVLILETFVGPCPEGMECCHRDDDRSNNKLTNLRWGTRGDNIRDCYRNGRGDKSGEKNGCAVMTEGNVIEAIEFRNTDPKTWTYKALGRRYGVSAQAVFHAVKGIKWKHLQKKDGDL